MAEIYAFDKTAEQNRNCGIMPQALGWDSAGRGSTGEIGRYENVLEVLGEIYQPGKGRASARPVEYGKAGKCAGLSLT